MNSAEKITAQVLLFLDVRCWLRNKVFPATSEIWYMHCSLKKVKGFKIRKKNHKVCMPVGKITLNGFHEWALESGFYPEIQCLPTWTFMCITRTIVCKDFIWSRNGHIY
jgi:hypothetical protein